MTASTERPPDWPATEQSRWARPLMSVAIRLLMRLDVQGMERFPEPPMLVTANHLSYFDHMPNGRMFDIGALSVMTPAGLFSTRGRLGSVTVKLLGATPIEHWSSAPMTTGLPITFPLRVACGSTSSVPLGRAEREGRSTQSWLPATDRVRGPPADTVRHTTVRSPSSCQPRIDGIM